MVSTPDFFAGAAALLESVPLAVWQEWLALRVVSAAAPYLSAAFVDANFAFYGTTLSGTPRNRDRWKRGVAVVEAALGEAVGPDLRGPALPGKPQGVDAHPGG